MTERLFGIETEYALSVTGARGARMRRGQALSGLMRRARRELPYLDDDSGNGIFLANGARFYIDSGGHPEVTTPECSNPWDVVRYIQAGDAILLRLANGNAGGRARMTFFRGNVDYSGSHSVWGTHENFMHRVDPSALPDQLIPHLVSRLVYTGAGGFNNVSAGVEFMVSPRTAHITQAVSGDSTTNRGIFHEKREDLCAHGYHRLHVLCGESLCSELATWLRVGCTALVVAMCDAGLRPGDGVALRDPLAAMRLFAGDPTCRAAAQSTTGRRLTAIDIQHHYLAQAEAHLGRSYMPPWAGDVCRRWRATLESLGNGWEAVATTLDWAIKLALYRDCVRRRGMEWESLAQWKPVVQNLSTACRRAMQGECSLTAEAALDPASPLAAEVKRMRPILEKIGLTWQGVGQFLHIRDELFEIDTRFAQVGPEGIFARLDAAGVLTHRVPGTEGVEHAVDNPPDIGRARVRGNLVRELASEADRYCCSWDGIWDCEEDKRVDLTDPFVVSATWSDTSVRGPAPSSWRRLLFDTGTLPPTRRHPRRRPRLEDADAAGSRSDPIALNHAALALRKRDRLDEAERLLRRAIEIEDARVAPDSPKRAHRRNNLAIVLMRAGKLTEAMQVTAEAWKLKGGAHDLTSCRILFARIALQLLLEKHDVQLYLGQLKTLLERRPLRCLGDIEPTWDIPDVLEMLCERLDAADAYLLVDTSEVLNHRPSVAALNEYDAWNSAPALSLDMPWPD